MPRAAAAARRAHRKARSKKPPREITQADLRDPSLGLITTEEVALALRLRVGLVYKMAREGDLPCIRLNARNILFNGAAIADWLEAGGVQKNGAGE
jgi:excisionase family DNA binding protein